MCTKILTILLIPLLVLGNSFAHVPCGAAHSSQDDNRTHFHVGFGSNHAHDGHEHSHAHGSHSHGDHDHDNESPASKPNDHDSDAIYLVVPEGEFSTPNCVTIDLDASSVFGHVSTRLAKPQVCLDRCVETFSRFHGPPLYLLHCAIRI
ncbi:MAG: hypothetical protein MUC83_00490 [Pirellula sp.]|jgi:hypothetical protein|nr:hypothetical protein [Pirellula sp.]